MKIIFLDIDGILNREGCKYLIDGIHFVMPEKLELLKQLVDRTEARVVLSSTWRFGWINQKNGITDRESRHFEALRDKLLEYGIELLDHTPVLDGTMECRGEEIDLWMKEWDGEEIQSLVILDDLNGRYLRPYSDRLVRTSYDKGLLPKHVELAVKILNRPMEDKKPGKNE